MIYNVFGISESSYDYEDTFDFDTFMEETEAAPEKNLHEATFRVVNEMEYNWYRIKEAACLDELINLNESGELEVFNEAGVLGFIDKAIQWLKKLWEKIKEIFKNIIMYFNAKFGKNDTFFRKYEKSLNNAVNTKSFENMKFTGYTFENLYKDGERALSDLSKQYEDSTKNFSYFKEYNNLENEIKGIKDETTLKEVEKKMKDMLSSDKKTDIIEKFRAILLNMITSSNTSTATDKEFKSDLDEWIKGSTTKETLDITGNFIRQSFSKLKNIDKDKSLLEKSLREIDKGIKNGIRELESEKKSFNKQSMEGTDIEHKKAAKQSQYTTFNIEFMQASRSILTTAIGIVLSNMKLYAAQSRMLAAKAITYNSKKHENESTVIGGSMLDNVTLI